MSTETVTPASRREVWLTIALAVARDGLPEPERFSFNQFVDHSEGEAREYRTLHLTFDSHAAALDWLRWLGIEEQARRHDRPELGIRYVTTDYVRHVRDGWVWNISGEEPLPTATGGKLAADVAAAILTPDADEPLVPVDEQGLADTGIPAPDFEQVLDQAQGVTGTTVGTHERGRS